MAFFILALLASRAWAGEDYWVWVDKNGVTNYAEHQPDNVPNAKHVTSSVPFGERAASDAQDNTADNGAAQAKAVANPPQQSGGVNPDAAISKQKAAIAAQIDAIKRKNCAIGKHNLAQLESYANIRVKDANGNERVLSDKEHQADIEQAKQIIVQNCSG